MRLFFDVNNNQIVFVKYCLNKLVTQNQFLFSFCRLSTTFLMQNIKNTSKVLKHAPERNKVALRTVTLIGNFLFRLNRKKENYMNNYSYQLGQLFSAMDELHIGYCMDIRKGSIPSTLVGNMCYSVALQNPLKALEIFAERLKPYSGWADRLLAISKAELSKPVKNGIYARRWMKKNIPKIHEAVYNGNLSANSDPIHKAELMLGYLAGRPFEDKNNENFSQTTILQENSND